MANDPEQGSACTGSFLATETVTGQIAFSMRIAAISSVL
jgi:hypothetical protein